ncbi:hypothetical protein [Mycoplasma bradburyae]|uniref:hypothetical protein n=1 Tax=Mycoplasma bradburyae TaxID=2963128 RepID=UPI002341E8AE|nr:hypothetical protein [Mycoplasma bradburyae]MDC4182508.1 hypothetical protein [Mycoplasma bradburyae]
MFKYISDKKLIDSCFEVANKLTKLIQATLAKHLIDTRLHSLAETKEKLACEKEGYPFGFDFILELTRPATALKGRANNELKDIIKKDIQEVINQEFANKDVVIKSTSTGFSIINLFNKNTPETKFFIEFNIYKFDGKNFYVLKKHRTKVNEVWTKVKNLNEIKHRMSLVENDPDAWLEFKERYLFWLGQYLEENKEKPSSLSCKTQALNDAFNKFWQNQLEK